MSMAGGGTSGTSVPVRWAELRPDQFTQRLDACPIGYLPMGLCEPHGHVAAYGLDTVRADWICDRLAHHVGGIVAPTQGYQIHECGFHARWLQDVVGETNARLGAMPPHVICLTFLYQLRAMVNSGMRGVVVVDGHLGGNERDLQRWAAAFADRFGVPVVVTSDMLVSPFPTDHAGRFEISALMYIRPELVDLSLLDRATEAGSGGALAVGDTAADASAAHGEVIMLDALERIADIVRSLVLGLPRTEPITYEPIERLYSDLLADQGSWVTMSPHADQPSVHDTSQWKAYEHPNPVRPSATVLRTNKR